MIAALATLALFKCAAFTVNATMNSVDEIHVDDVDHRFSSRGDQDAPNPGWGSEVMGDADVGPQTLISNFLC